MPCDIWIVSTWPPRRCGIATFSRDLTLALHHFTAEIGHVRVAAIDNGHGPYDGTVGLVIDQYDPDSWRQAFARIAKRAKESQGPTAVVLQHEFGLDPDAEGYDARGNNFVEMAKALNGDGITTLVYLHTVLDDPNDHQRETIMNLARYSDGLVVTTESAIEILESETYGIAHAKLKHIDHGIRMQHPSQFDRLSIKQAFCLENRFLVTTLGLLSPGKGVDYGIRGYGRFLAESCTPEQRRRIVYLVAGQCHPEFVRCEGGKPYRQYMATIQDALDQADVKWCRVTGLGATNFEDFDVVFLDAFLDEEMFLNLYGASNVMLLPYLNMQQISSGILADTLGSGRAAITTKFRYARELIHSNKPCPDGLIVGRFSRGILVDVGEPSVLQIAQGLDYLVFNYGKRLMMEKQAHQRGYQMRWDNSAWALLQYIAFIQDQKDIVTGRGVRFTRQKPSSLDVYEYCRVQITPTIHAVTRELKPHPASQQVPTKKA